MLSSKSRNASGTFDLIESDIAERPVNLFGTFSLTGHILQVQIQQGRNLLLAGKVASLCNLTDSNVW